MKRVLRIVGIILLTGIIGMQFYRPARNNSPVTQDDIIYNLDIPTGVKRTIVNACYDCHSSQTRYPWYSNFAPVSWMLANHVKEGKEPCTEKRF